MDVTIVRFGKEGRTELPSGGGFNWVVTMEPGSTLTGTLTVPADATGQPAFPGNLRLSGRMIITVQPDGSPTPINLRSRDNPMLEGSVAGWPPYDAQLTLKNGPIAYFDERDIANPTAVPVLSVMANHIALGPGPSLFFSTVPHMLNAALVDLAGSPWSSGPIGGVALTWSDTSDPSTPPVRDFYHLYRNLMLGTLDDWTLAASLASDQTSFVDTAYDGSADVQYLVTHAFDLNFGYFCEGVFDVPTTVAAIPEPGVFSLLLTGLVMLLRQRCVRKTRPFGRLTVGIRSRHFPERHDQGS